MKNNSDNKKNIIQPQGDKNPTKRPPGSLFLWLLVFFCVASLTSIASSFSSRHPDELSSDSFLQMLDKGIIETAEIKQESNRVLMIKGTYHVNNVSFSQPVNTDLQVPATSEENNATLDNTDSAPVFDLTLPNTSQVVLKGYSTRIFATDQLINNLHMKGVKVTYLQQSNWWKDLLLNLAIALPILLFFYFMFARQIRGAGKDAMLFGKNRARIIMPNENKTKFDDVAGCEEAKEDIKEIVDYLKDPLKFKLLGGKIPHGALLTGPPGTGKTLMARAVSGEAGVPFFSISGSDFVEMFVGVGASRVRDMFREARKHSPSVIFIDEIDAVGRSRFSGIGGGHDEREQTLNAMLVEMDGLEQQDGVIVLAATNRPDVLDQALLRPGRFDRQIVIDLPDINGRRKILDVHVKNVRMDESVDLDAIAKSTPGFSGADLENLINEAALLAARREKEKVTQDEFEEARDKVCFGAQRRSRKIPERDRMLTAWHEAGHTIVNLFLEYSIPLHKVTIIPRGQALGLTMMMEHEDRYSRSRGEMLDLITTDLGGRVAEEIALNDITAGASQDIAQATGIAHAMVCSYGMSDAVGPIQYGDRGEHIYLGRDIMRNEACSETTQREIDMEIKRIVETCKARARAILTEHRDCLDKLAMALLEKETLSAQEVYELLNMQPQTEHNPISLRNDPRKDAEKASESTQTLPNEPQVTITGFDNLQ